MTMPATSLRCVASIDVGSGITQSPHRGLLGLRERVLEYARSSSATPAQRSGSLILATPHPA
jgi:hypothetical protein